MWNSYGFNFCISIVKMLKNVEMHLVCKDVNNTSSKKVFESSTDYCCCSNNSHINNRTEFLLSVSIQVHMKWDFIWTLFDNAITIRNSITKKWMKVFPFPENCLLIIELNKTNKIFNIDVLSCALHEAPFTIKLCYDGGFLYLHLAESKLL